MSSNNESAEQKLIDWQFSQNSFVVLLRSRNTFDEKAFALGLQLLKEYLEVNKDCVSSSVLQIIVEIYYQLNIALQRSMRTNNSERTDAILEASYQIRKLIYE